MTRSSFTFAGLTLTLLFGFFAAVTPGQSLGTSSGVGHSAGPQSDGQRATAGPPWFKTGVDLVSLDICVRDPSGRFVPDLSPDDFVVLEDGTPQQIGFLVPSSAVSLTGVLLIDVSQSMWGSKLKHALKAASDFAELLRPDDRLAMIAFNHRATRVHAFGDDPTHVPTALSSSIGAILSSNDSSRLSTALYDALLVGANEILRARGGPLPETREVIIVLSDGEDTSSLVGFDEVLPVLRRSGALVYSVSLRANERGEWLGANWPMLAVARDTGARALAIPRLEALPALYREIDAEVRHMYRLAYVSNNDRRDGQWRTISVRVPTRDARVRTRSGYYAPRAVTAPF